MRESTLKWIGDADAFQHLKQFRIADIPESINYQQTRQDDLYISLVGELFDSMHKEDVHPSDWARLGNSLAQFGLSERVDELYHYGISLKQAKLFSSAAFYLGGFPASACLTMRTIDYRSLSGDGEFACFDLLARRNTLYSVMISDLRQALIQGDFAKISFIKKEITASAKDALDLGPDEWIPIRLLECLLARFEATNIRAILPVGENNFWTPLVTSFVNRGSWDYFPSQIEAIHGGLLDRNETFSLQMPTGAGKTALCETLLFYHLKSKPDEAAVLLVPYRSLASELRGSLVKRLNNMGIPTRCAYGGTVPSGDEIRAISETKVLVATPESLSGILGSDPNFTERISLVICDEGHLLDAPSRGVSLELLLARMKNRGADVRRFVFMSAIVPNIDEINAWLGGCSDTVIKSDYRPGRAEFSVLRKDNRNLLSYTLEMNPHEREPVKYRIDQFLRPADFQYLNIQTGRMKRYNHSGINTLAIVSARKSLAMGTVVVFSANKGGPQGAIGLADEFLTQIAFELPLPRPLDFANHEAITSVSDYLTREYGLGWIGTRSLNAGVVLHHGDVPQETREILEELLRKRSVSLCICTNTLAEGVNFPIRTLVLYSIQRIKHDGNRENMLVRDIKNLVGRVGRAGSTTRGLVICANEKQWPLLYPVASQTEGESVVGALRKLVEGLSAFIARKNISLTNEILEQSPVVHSLIDGIDATLVDLAAEEIGQDEFIRIASALADQTYASSQTDNNSKQFLRDVFSLRAERIAGLHSVGRLGWVRETGAHARMVDNVEVGLLPMRQVWDDVLSPLDTSFVNIILEWSWLQLELQIAIREGYHLEQGDDLDSVKELFGATVRSWLSGLSFAHIAEKVGQSVDEILGIHSRIITFSLQTIVEQGLSLLEKILQSRQQMISPSILQFTEHLRFGVPTKNGCFLAASGMTCRSAFVAIGNELEMRGVIANDRNEVFVAAQKLVDEDREKWRTQLGELVFAKTIRDLGIG